MTEGHRLFWLALVQAGVASHLSKGPFQQTRRIGDRIAESGCGFRHYPPGLLAAHWRMAIAPVAAVNAAATTTLSDQFQRPRRPIYRQRLREGDTGDPPAPPITTLQIARRRGALPGRWWYGGARIRGGSVEIRPKRIAPVAGKLPPAQALFTELGHAGAVPRHTALQIHQLLEMPLRACEEDGANFASPIRMGCMEPTPQSPPVKCRHFSGASQEHLGSIP